MKFHEFLKLKCWWANMRAEIEELPRQCKIYENFAKSPEPPKSLIPIMVSKLFSTKALDIVGPISTPPP